MKLIEEIESKRDKEGDLRKMGKFSCPDCNKIVERSLSSGKKQKSCGCIKNYKHGECNTRLYRTWFHMKQRILNPNTERYKDYGGRGITICDEWLSFIPFRDWSLNNGYADNLTIDRKENEGNYEPSNCQWLTSKENSQKRRTSKATQEIVNEIRELDKTGLYTQR